MAVCTNYLVEQQGGVDAVVRNALSSIMAARFPG